MNEAIDLGKLYGFSQCSPEGCGQIMPSNNNLMNTVGTQNNANVTANNSQSNQQPMMQQNMSRMPQATMNDQMIVSPQFRNTFSDPGANNQDITQQQDSTMMDNTTQQIPFTYEQFPTLNGFIRTQIGRRVRADFLIGSNSIVSKDGYLVGVGSNYLLINEIGTKTITAGDFYNLKFISFPY